MHLSYSELELRLMREAAKRAGRPTPTDAAADAACRAPLVDWTALARGMLKRLRERVPTLAPRRAQPPAADAQATSWIACSRR